MRAYKHAHTCSGVEEGGWGESLRRMLVRRWLKQQEDEGLRKRVDTLSLGGRGWIHSAWEEDGDRD